MGVILEEEKNKYLEQAEILKSGKIKQLHLRQEELELNITSCESAVEFTEQAFSNGNDVQILNLTKYMAQCLENLKDKNVDLSPCFGAKLETNQYKDLCDRMGQFRLIDINKERPDNYIATFTSPLFVSDEAEVVIEKKGNSNSAVNNGKIAMSPCFEGIAVQDVSVEDRDDGSRVVRFTPLQAGALTLVTYANGSSMPCFTVTSTVYERFHYRVCSRYDSDDMNDRKISVGIIEENLEVRENVEVEENLNAGNEYWKSKDLKK